MFSLEEIEAIRKYEDSEKVLKALKAKLSLAKHKEKITRQELINEMLLVQNVLILIMLEYSNASKNISILKKNV